MGKSRAGILPPLTRNLSLIEGGHQCCDREASAVLMGTQQAERVSGESSIALRPKFGGLPVAVRRPTPP